MEAFGLMNLIKSALAAPQSEEGRDEKARSAPPESCEATEPPIVEKAVSATENPFVTFCARHEERARKLRK